MKRFIAILLCVLITMVTACSSPPVETSQSSEVSEAVEAPRINEYGIKLSVDDFELLFNEAADGKYIMSEIKLRNDRNGSSKIISQDGTEISFSIIVENGNIIDMDFSKICSEKEEETYVEAASEIFKIAWNVFYPNYDMCSLDDITKELRYSEDIQLLEDLYVSFGNISALDDNRYISWGITSIKFHNELWNID